MFTIAFCGIPILTFNVWQKLPKAKQFLNIDSESTLTMSNCINARDIMSSHLVAFSNVIVIIIGCQLKDNAITDYLFDVNDGENWFLPCSLLLACALGLGNCL